MLLLLPGAATAGSAFSDEALRNMAYQGVVEQPVTLDDGRWQGAPLEPGTASRPRVELARNGIVRGDLDGDGRDEAAVLLLASSGGTGLFHHVAVVATGDDGPANVATTLLGDRFQIMRFAVEKGRVVVEAVVAGPDDPMCCPTQKLRRTLVLDGTSLTARDEPLGSVSLADLGRSSWRLIRIDGAEIHAVGEAITLELRDGKLVGSGGCNRYSADVTRNVAQDLSVGPVAATRRSCPPEVMAQEEAFLPLLERVDRFGFVMGELVLSYRGTLRAGTLFFAAIDAAP